MKRSQLREIVLEAMKGYSPQIGQTKGGTTDDFRNILTKIAKGRPEGDPVRGNKILDRANPDNVAKILTRTENTSGKSFPTNIRPQGSWNELVDVKIAKDEQGEYNLQLFVYSTSGQTRQLKLGDRAVPINQFTAEHVIDRVGTVYKLDDADKQELADFADSIPSKLN